MYKKKIVPFPFSYVISVVEYWEAKKKRSANFCDIHTHSIIDLFAVSSIWYDLKNYVLTFAWAYHVIIQIYLLDFDTLVFNIGWFSFTEQTLHANRLMIPYCYIKKLQLMLQTYIISSAVSIIVQLALEF